MTLSARWLAFCKPYLEKLLALARTDSSVPYDEYKELKKTYDRMHSEQSN